MKILHLGPDLFHADGEKGGHTYMTKLMVAFRNFSKAPKKCHENSRDNCNLRGHQLKMQ
jgi:hypothetical protein